MTAPRDKEQNFGDKSFQYSSVGILSIAAGVLSLLAIAATLTFRFPRNVFPNVFDIVLLGIPLLALVGIGLGVVSLIQKEKKILWILGCTLNGLILSAICLFLLFIQASGGISHGCIFGTAMAWIDQNENAVWDPNELPLAGVQFVVSNSRHGADFSERPTSDASGAARLIVWPYTCNTLPNIIIQATPPQGYQATTPSQVNLSGDEVRRTLDNTYLFGFMKQASP